jgi:NitT/TauT family transport system permease protein
LEALNKTKINKKINLFSVSPVLSPIIVLVAMFGVLEIIAKKSGISFYILPPPSRIVISTIQKFPLDILPQFLFTFKIIGIGFVTATFLGMVLAAIFSQFNLITKAITPVIILLVITPMITLIPLMVLWLGVNPNFRVFVVIVQATPIITLNTLSGFTNLETDKVEFAKSVGATKMQRFTKIIFMNSMPQVFTGIKLGAVFATIGAVSADFVSGNIGLGFRILQYTKYNMTDLTYGCILIIAIIGIFFFTIIGIIEKRVVVWKY